MIIYDEKCKLGIIWDLHFYSENKSFEYGKINFIIEDELFPKKFADNFTLRTVFSNLKSSFKTQFCPGGKTGYELGNREVDFIKLDYGEEPDIFVIETTELGNKFGKECHANCLHLRIGYCGNEERLFYSEDFGKTYRETRFPKGTVERIVAQLPSAESLRRGTFSKTMVKRFSRPPRKNTLKS